MRRPVALLRYPHIPTTRLDQANSSKYQLISSWYKNKHWWKRNAPIVGGAGGGALVGGLLGGGKGAIIGGAVGGGGGYLYKHLKHHNTRDYNRLEHPHPQAYGKSISTQQGGSPGYGLRLARSQQ